MTFWFNKILRNDSYIPFIVENNEEAIAFFEFKNFESYRPLYNEYGIFLNPDYIGRGLMKNIIIEEILYKLEINDLIGFVR